MKLGLIDSLLAPIKRIFGMLPIKPPDCDHEFKPHKNPDSPDGPGELFMVCRKCGAERCDEVMTYHRGKFA